MDAADRGVRLQAAAWAVAFGLVGGGGGGAGIGVLLGVSPILTALAGVVICGGGTYIVAVATTFGGGGVAGRLHMPTAQSTPRRAEYSQAQALAAQGRYGDAALAYEIAALESEGDPEPYMRLGRLYRDDLNQSEEALAWFRRARTDADLTAGQELLVIQEIIDLYVRKLGTPRKAIPELIQLCERFPETPAAATAAKELDEIRALLADERDGLATFTSAYLDRRRRE